MTSLPPSCPHRHIPYYRRRVPHHHCPPTAAYPPSLTTARLTLHAQKHKNHCVKPSNRVCLRASLLLPPPLSFSCRRHNVVANLMGSFVPFGGFFPTPSDFRAPLAGMRAPFTRCNECNVSYEKELRATPKEGSSVSVAGDQSSTLPSWLQSAEADPSKAREVVAQYLVFQHNPDSYSFTIQQIDEIRDLWGKFVLQTTSAMNDKQQEQT
ncbi:hypothetical protein RND81_12G191800 [Saponaria officinalis]|uniref:Uncharacterized protein n=1 Tax=Saponaria officinalis TaxID=3572 RepID=A0AAW1HCQ8_SAPOF